MILYTKHAEDKLKRRDIKSFSISRRMINNFLKSKKKRRRTRYGEYAKVDKLDNRHDIRIIYDIIGDDMKVITFHIARTGRY